MTRTLLTLLLCAIFSVSYAQIICPDTVCVNTPVSLNTSDTALSYSWIIDTVNIDQVDTAIRVVASGGSVSVPNGITMINDNSNYYAFYTNDYNELVRLNFGTNPNTVPVATSLGTLGGALNSSHTQGVDIVKENNTWVGFVAEYASLVRINFGSSLTNTPIVTTLSFTSNLAFPHQFTIKQYGTEWVAFAANRVNNAITRFDFGTSITNTPVATNIGTGANMDAPCNFSLYKNAGVWYMLVTNLLGAKLTLFTFGANLKNNNPAAVDLGNPGNYLTLPRTVMLLSDCNQLIAYITDENEHRIKLSFPNGITSAPVVTDLGLFGPSGSAFAGSCTYWYNGALYALYTSFKDNTIYSSKPLSTTAPYNTTYYNPVFNYTFPTTGIHDITLYCDQGDASGPKYYCKQVYVKNCAANINNIAEYGAVEIYPNPSNGRFIIDLQNMNGRMADIKCYNSIGQLISNMSVPVVNKTAKTSIDISGQPAGIYQIRITTEDGSITTRKVSVQ